MTNQHARISCVIEADRGLLTRLVSLVARGKLAVEHLSYSVQPGAVRAHCQFGVVGDPQVVIRTARLVARSVGVYEVTVSTPRPAAILPASTEMERQR